MTTIPDGETNKLNWIADLADLFAQCPDLEELPPQKVGDAEGNGRSFRPREGVAPEAVRFGDLGFRADALRSYELFAQLKAEGVIPDHVRFQVSLPTPLAPIFAFFGWVEKRVGLEDRAATGVLGLETAFEGALLGECEAICAAIPHDQLAIQWDVCNEILMLEGFFPAWWTGEVLAGLKERFHRLASAVPEDVLLGWHTCYGDYNHEHFSQPNPQLLTDLANWIVESAGRRTDWIHLPVPRDRSDDEYFAPFEKLPDTKIYLGLVHNTDGAQGTRKRIEAASRHLSNFGVATECGLGRRPADTIEGLLRVHAEVAAPLADRAGVKA